MNPSFDAENASLQDWQQYIERIHPSEIELGLDRITAVADVLGLRESTAKVVTVAGTNGKGSTVEALRALLAFASQNESNSSLAGSFDEHTANNCVDSSANNSSANSSAHSRSYAVGCYTSPHLLRFNERINVNGKSVEDDVLCEAFREVEYARGEVDLTYFEFTTLAALWVFQQQPLDVLILEVGLGGRLDAVNILDADIAIITNIALDHVDWLGETVEEIAIEKAGIVRPQQRLVLGMTGIPNSLQSIINRQPKNSFDAVYYAESRDAQNDITMPGECGEGENLDASLVHGWTTCRDDGGSLAWFGHRFADDSALPQRGSLNVRLESDRPLAPKLHLSAWSCAMQAALMLEGKQRHIENLLQRRDVGKLMEQTTLLGRQSVHAFAERQCVVDVAHNIASIERFLEYYASSRQLPSAEVQALTKASINDVLIFGAMADKDIIGMLGKLLPVFDRTVFTALPSSDRAITAEDLLEVAKSAELAESVVHCSDTVAAALDWAIQHTSVDDKIFVVGSFITAAEAIAVLDGS